jgi:hypothetical protein
MYVDRYSCKVTVTFYTLKYEEIFYIYFVKFTNFKYMKIYLLKKTDGQTGRRINKMTLIVAFHYFVCKS